MSNFKQNAPFWNMECRRLQALLYDILPPTTTVSDYDIGLEKRSALVFWLMLSSGSKFVTDSSNIRRFFYNRPRCLRQHK